MRISDRRPALIAFVAIALCASSTLARAQADQRRPGVGDERTRLVGPGPDLSDLNPGQSEMRGIILRYSVDEATVERLSAGAASTEGQSRMKEFYTQWLDTLSQLDFGMMGEEGRVDYLLFKNYLTYRIRRLATTANELSDQAPFVPFAPAIISLEEHRRRLEWADPRRAAALLDSLNTLINSTKNALAAKLKTREATNGSKEDRRKENVLAVRASDRTGRLRDILKHWFDFYNGYDPEFTWWVAEPFKSLDQSMKSYADFLREKVAGLAAGDDTTIIGYPIGRGALVSELAREMVPYSPEELIAIANREFDWCEQEMKKASRELGFGEDWHRALEAVKNQYVPPGGQPELIRKLAGEAVDFVEAHNLVTVPDLARQTWWEEMLSPEQQLTSPFFLGGENILVAYPTSAMSQEEKLMSMRGNNIHFARATVFHELIPGHHLQWYMNERYRTYRRTFGTPFWTEGWSFYWEMLLWDKGFSQSPEDRIGMLFWRMHRCARIIFSLNFHLGTMTPEQCIDFLVDRVGHERANAAAEVRRSFIGWYGPLYQCAYMVGALQFRALHHELVDSGRMSDRSFHDAILKQNNIPVEMVRAILTNQTLTRDFAPGWKFYQDEPEAH